MVLRLLNARGMVAVACALLTSPAAQAQQILTAIESEFDDDGPADTQVSPVAGQLLSTTFGGANTRALTNYGVNKIYASGTADYEQYATSAWLDTYTVGGSAGTMVDLSFSFTVDGAANFSGDSAGFNFNVVALRGGSWSMSGAGESSPSIYGPATSGSVNERLILTQRLPNRVTQADLRDFEGFYNYTNNQGQAGAFQSHVTYRDLEDAYSLETLPAGAAVPQETRYYATGFRNFVNGVPTTPLIPYTANAATMAQGSIRNQLVANYSLLDLAALCAGEGCEFSDIVPPTDLTLSFRLAAGSTFTLATMLYADDVREGTIDFFNTAKVSGISVSNGGTLTSLSGTLAAGPGGSYSYPAAAAAVPEPESWAMMIAGFGLLGAATRRRSRAIQATI